MLSATLEPQPMLSQGQAVPLPLLDSCDTTQVMAATLVNEKPFALAGSGGQPLLLVDEGFFSAGERVDHFRITCLIGHGGMAEVYLAYDTKLERKVALKVLRSRQDPTQLRQRFLFEVRTLASMNHPNVVSLYSTGETWGLPYLALEYVEGPTLREKMQEEQLSSREIITIALALARVLKDIHRRGIVHCDLKPENIIIGKNGQPKLLDFGLALNLAAGETQKVDLAQPWPPAPAADGPAASAQHPGILAGTPQYMSPEQWRGECSSGSIDIWAFGAILYELLASRPPVCEERLFDQAAKVCSADPIPPPISQSAIPAELAELTVHCLHKDPHARATVDEVVSSLELLCLCSKGALANCS